ncbi:MAG: hypothetical protein JWQ68_64 [Cryobacterium sp.]|jgi:hypothetical protein|nr:hypothetical protein [Cryobacterium sp.]
MARFTPGTAQTKAHPMLDFRGSLANRNPVASAALVIVIALALTGCDREGGGSASAPSGSVTDGDAEGPGSSGDPSRAAELLIECFYPDGASLGTFASLMETWASTNYLKIEYCEAHYADGPPVALTDKEKAATDAAAAGIPDAGDPADLLLRVVAACTRIGSEDGAGGFSSTPVSILQGALVLCPEAPQAGIIRDKATQTTQGY